MHAGGLSTPTLDVCILKQMCKTLVECGLLFLNNNNNVTIKTIAFLQNKCTVSKHCNMFESTVYSNVLCLSLHVDIAYSKGIPIRFKLLMSNASEEKSVSNLVLLEYSVLVLIMLHCKFKLF